MKPPQYLRSNSILGGLALALALATAAPSAHANVYATNIKLNGALTGSASVSQGSSVTITYILNDTATAGVTIKILSGEDAVRTISIPSGTGTSRGLNTVTWDGKDGSNANVPAGNYSVSITAGATGYSSWTQINNSSDPGYSIYWPSGIAVDTKTDSPYYGRIIVANGADYDEYIPGIVKLNADGSFADEGPEGPSTAGYPFSTDGYLGDSCTTVKYGTDDRLYFNDWTGKGKIVACDMTMSTYQVIADSANFFGTPAGGNFVDIDVTDPGTPNARAWFADQNYPSVGVWCWPLDNGGIADPNFAGTQVIATGSTAAHYRSGYGLMIDEAGDIFIGQVRANPSDVEPRVTRINDWQSASLPIRNVNISWQVGQSDDTMRDVADVSIDSRSNPQFVSAAFYGYSGGLKILNAADGSAVTSINQDVDIYYMYTSWDKVGNVYGASDAGNWQVFSPPGANSATTVAVPTVQVTTGSSLVAATITSITPDGSGNLLISYSGGSGSQFVLMSSSSVTASRDSWTRGEIKTAGSGTFTVSIGSGLFYCVKSE